MPLQDEDTINQSSAESARLKEIPVPVSLPQTQSEGTISFMLPKDFIRAPPPWKTPENGLVGTDDPVDWDMDPYAFRFLCDINQGKLYSGPSVAEAIFEKVIDRFEKAVKADVLPELGALRSQLSSIVPNPVLIDVAYDWWVQRRKQLAMPLTRGLRLPPDPEDPDTTGVAFRPREKEGVRRLRSNNKKTYNLMASLHDEFNQLHRLCESIKRRERLKLDFHQASGEYIEVAHRTLVHRLHRQRTGQAGWKDDLDDSEMGRPSAVHKKVQPVSGARSGAPPGYQDGVGTGRIERSHHKRRHPGPGRPPKETISQPAAGSRPRDRDRDRNRSHRATGAAPATLSASRSFVCGSYLRPSEGAEAAPAYDDVDSEEEAFSHLLLAVDMQRRDELVPLLPLHLRKLRNTTSPSEPGDMRQHGTLQEALQGSTVPSVTARAATSPLASLPAQASMGICGRLPETAPSGTTRALVTEGNTDTEPPWLRVQQQISSAGQIRLRVGRGNRIVVERGDGALLCYGRVRSQWCPSRKPIDYSSLFTASPWHVTEDGGTPDEAWRNNVALPIKHGPLLFNFACLANAIVGT